MSYKNLELYIDLNKSLNYVYFQAETLTKRRNGTRKQNAFSFIRSILITNHSEEDILGAKITFEFYPDFIKILPVDLACLERGKNTVIDALDMSLDPEKLYNLTEALPSNVTIRLLDKNGDVLLTKVENFKLLPIEESASDDRIDEILASFVTPNDDRIRNLLSTSAVTLNEKYGLSGFVGYQLHDPNTVIQQLDALYLTVQSLNIRYANPPASFEKTFQRVRLPYSVLQEKVGTCLDISILFASLAEAAGLRPLILLIEGHALFGAWLDDEYFSSILEDNRTFLLNQASAGFNHLVLLDVVDLTSGSVINFRQTSERAYQKLRDTKTFYYALDIYSARKEGLLPIPTPREKDKKIDLSLFENSDNVEYLLPEVNVEDRRYLSDKVKNQVNRFDYWEEKLLDLNLRNRLINLPFGQTGVQVVVPEAGAFLGALMGREKMSLLPIEYPFTVNDKKAILDFPISSFKEQADEAYRRGAILLTGRGKTDIESYLKNLARKANTSIEESGCNPLFITLGLIKWYDNDKAAEHGTGALYAPIFLLPIKMPRRKVGLNYYMEYSFDDLQLNTTIFEYFHQTCGLDFSSLIGSLKQTPDGKIDFRIIYNTIRQIISEKKNWALIEETSVISLFSFAHYVMWTDIKTRREKLLENDVVASLVSGASRFQPKDDALTLKDIDEKINPVDMATPLPVDSSQILAINDALKGESFILDGPPGTGKSQTIANMIVNFMYHGKTVLFVAEKEVALQVVKNRLTELGLGDFCLQIANPNAAKANVLDQLGSLLDLAQTENAQDFNRVADEVLEERKKLNNILKNLRDINGFFMSPYEAIITYLENRNKKGLFEFSEDYITSLTTEKYEEIKAKLSRIVILNNLLQGYYYSPFKPYSKKTYMMEERDRLVKRTEILLSLTDEVDLAFKNLFIKKPLVKRSRKTAENLKIIYERLQKDVPYFGDFIGDSDFQNSKEKVIAYLNLLLDKARHDEYLLTYFTRDIFFLSAKSLLEDYRDSQDLGFFAKRKKQKEIVKNLKMYLKRASKFPKHDLESVLIHLDERQKDVDLMNESDQLVKFFFNDLKPMSVEDGEDIKERMMNTIAFNDAILNIELENKVNRSSLISYFKKLSNDHDALFDKSIAKFLSSFDAYLKEEKVLKDEYFFDASLYPDDKEYFLKVRSNLRSLKENSGSLSEWVKLLNAIDALKDLVPEAFLDLYREGKVNAAKLCPIFESNVCYRFLSVVLPKLDLASLNSEDTDQIVNKYSDLITEFRRLTVVETAARVTAKFPTAPNENSAQSTDSYKLKKLAKNGGRGVSLRNIFRQFGGLIHKLCPCFLMSPIAVAQYLDPDSHTFDAVIFDEASQIPTSEAVGAIARGKSCIISGDQMQMPPSNFFMSTVSLSGDSTDEFVSLQEDLESLLDDAIVLGFPRKRLTWHYRSKHESLISFSNKKFYDNSLLTFPSPEKEKTAVSFHYVGGLYERGRAINRLEAKAVVEEIIKRLKDPVKSQQSIGVVTFNEAQQNLVEDMLDRALAKNNLLNVLSGGETIFVKNLENVQGDERDVILFSICYAPEVKGGSVSLNFGPLSREKGERRLNVAVSRSREEMHIFSSIYPEQIRAEKAKNQGATFLRDFLNFALRGVETLPNYFSQKIRSNKVSVANFLANDLKKLGYDVETDLGNSTFKIDLAIKDKDNPENYLLGILLDGESYASSPTCIDRNIVEPNSLKRLGWRLLKLWSVEYLDHPAEIVRKIVTILNESPGKPVVVEKEKVFDIPTFKKRNDNAKRHAVSYLIYKDNREHASFNPANQSNIKALTEYLLALIAQEGPISRHLLEERVKETFKIPRLTSPYRSAINVALQELKPVTENLSGTLTFYWPSFSVMNSYHFYRLPNLKDNWVREITDISFLELGNAYSDILEEQGAMTKDDLYKQTSLLFGFKVLTKTQQNHLEKALNYNNKKRHGIVVDYDGTVSIDNALYNEQKGEE